MYHLLIEAAGLRQSARIHADFYSRILAQTDELAARHGFSKLFHDGDLLAYADTAGHQPDAAAVCALLRSVLNHLRAFSESLLDVVVLADYITDIEGRAAWSRLVDSLRFARDPGSIYLSPTVRAALGPLVTTQQSGGIERVVGFTSDGIQRAAPFFAAVTDPALVERLIAVLQSGSGRIVLTGSDPALVEATARVACDRAHTGCVVVDGRLCEDVAAFLSATVARMPELPELRAREMTDHERRRDLRRSLTYVSRRARQPAMCGVRSRTRVGELALTLRTLFADSGVSLPILLVLNADYVREGRAVLDEIIDDAGASPTVLIHSERDADYGATGISIAAASAAAPSASRAYWTGATAAGDAPRGGQGEDLTTYFTRALAVGHRRLVYLAGRCGGALDRTWYSRVLPMVGITLAEHSRLIEELAHEGVLLNEQPLRVHPEVQPIIGELLSAEERRSIDSALGAFAVQIASSGAGCLSPDLWIAAAGGLEGAERHRVWHRVVHSAALGGDTNTLERLTDSVELAGSPIDVSVAGARTIAHLRGDGGPSACAAERETLRVAAADESQPPDVRAPALLACGELALAERDYPTALERCKRAVMISEGEGFASLRAESHLVMARIMLAQRRVSDAGPYLSFAREEGSDGAASALIAEAIDAIRVFHTGNLTRAARLLSAAADRLLQYGFTDWVMLMWFLAARIAFDFGQYDDASQQLEVIREFALGIGHADAARVATAWRERARMNAGSATADLHRELERIPQSSEVLLVRAEICTRENEFEEAVRLLKLAAEREIERPNWPRVGVSWGNGYADIEDLVLGGREGNTQLLQIVRGFLAWSLAQIGREDEAAAIFYELTRTDARLGEDPYTALYTYLYATTLPAERSTERDDRTTVLGKAVKLLQERMSRIDDYQDKMRFLNANAWNRRLMETARAQNLM